MKYSQFNTFFKYNDHDILFNTLSNSFIAVAPLLKDLLDAATLNGNLEELRDIHPTFYNKLVDKRFIIENDVNEVEIVKQMQKEIDILDNSLFHLIINPTMNCNFKCWYCYESHIKGSRLNQNTMEKVKLLIKGIIVNSQELKTFRLSWFGGEPLLQFRDVIKPLQTYCYMLCKEYKISFSSGFTTNGFLITDEMITFFKKNGVIDFQITLDGNRDLHDSIRFVNKDRGSYDIIVSNILNLCKNGFKVSLRINYTKVNISTITDIIPDLLNLETEYRKNLKISFHKVWQEKNPTLEEKLLYIHKEFRNAGLVSIWGDLPDNVRNSCYADRKNHATINYNGEVFKCTARNFSNDSKEGILDETGNIKWNNKLKERLNIKFKNKPCLSCSILPICNGGCSQHALEHQGIDYCEYDFDEEKKKSVIFRKFEEMYNNA